MFGQVPALQVKDGERTVLLNQSNAILRFVAKINPESKLYPTDSIAAARVDAICDQEGDAFVGARVAKYKERFGFAFLNNEANQAQLEDAFMQINSEVVPRHLAHLVAVLEAGGTPWLAGTPEPSIADFCWAPALKAVADGKMTGQAINLDAYPQLVQFLERFYSLEAVANYYKTN